MDKVASAWVTDVIEVHHVSRSIHGVRLVKLNLAISGTLLKIGRTLLLTIGKGCPRP